MAKPSGDYIPHGGFVSNDRPSHASSPAKILLAISGSRDAGRTAHLPCLRDRGFAAHERLSRIVALVDASQW
jgi:hypothetical protein